MPKSRPVLIFGSILASLQFLAGAAALADIIGPTPFALFVLGVGSVQVGWAAYQQGIVVPVQDVAAYRTPHQGVIAGPASGILSGKGVDLVEHENPVLSDPPHFKP